MINFKHFNKRVKGTLEEIFMVDKPITRAERQAKIKANAEKLNDHINEGINNYVREAYLDGKEARKNERWYQAGEALSEAKLQAKFDADLEFNEEFNAWAEKQQEEYYAELDASEEQMLLAEDVIDVEFKPIGLPSSKRGRRQSKLLSSNDSLKSLPSTKEKEEKKKPNSPFSNIKKPS